jgi:hypothetical protein
LETVAGSGCAGGSERFSATAAAEALGSGKGAFLAGEAVTRSGGGSERFSAWTFCSVRDGLGEGGASTVSVASSSFGRSARSPAAVRDGAGPPAQRLERAPSVKSACAVLPFEWAFTIPSNLPWTMLPKYRAKMAAPRCSPTYQVNVPNPFA